MKCIWKMFARLLECHSMGEAGGTPQSCGEAMVAVALDWQALMLVPHAVLMEVAVAVSEGRTSFAREGAR